MNNQKGFAMVYCLIFLVVVGLVGTSMLRLSRIDRDNVSEHLKLKSATQAAMTAITVCEKSFLTDPTSMLAHLNKFKEDASYKWLLTSVSSADNEEKHVLQDEGNTSFSASIIDFGQTDDGTPVVKIKGIGYGRYGKTKTAIAQYELEGLEYVIEPNPMFGLYIAGEGYDFNTPIRVIGDVYFGGGFRFNADANGTIIDGRLKTGDKTSVSELNAGLTINGTALFQTPVKLQNYDLTINGKAGFKRTIEISKNVMLGGEGFFKSSITSSGVIDLSGNDVYHTGSCEENDFQNYSEIHSTSIDLAEKTGLPTGNETPIIANLAAAEAYAKDFSSFGYSELTATNLQSAYSSTPSSQKWNGFLVVKISSSTNVNFNSTNGIFNGKVIWIIEKSLSVNGKWYQSSSSAINIICVKSGNMSQFGWNGTMRGLIYITGSGSVNYSFNTGSSIEGAIVHSNTAGFQANTSSLFTIKYDLPLLEDLDGLGIITLPTYTPPSGTLTLIDCKIRPRLLSVQI